MLSKRSLFISVLTCVCTIATASPIATLTFDVAVQGWITTAGQSRALTNLGLPDHVSATLQLPFFSSSLYTYDNAYANSTVFEFGASQPSAGISITSPILEAMLGNASTVGIVNQGLADLGVTSRATSTAFPYTQRDYANLSKRDVHGVAAEDRFYTLFDSTIMQPSEDLTGAGNAKLLSMIRVNGIDYDPSGNIDPFSINDVPKMLLEMAQDKRGFAVQYTKTVDRYQDVNGLQVWDRPFELVYGGNARLTGFSVDGVDMMSTQVPEPSCLFLFAIGGLALLFRKTRI